jgi:hypothetical protein
MDERIAGTLAKLTTEGGKAIRDLPERGRALVKRVPPTVQIELAKLSSRGAHVFREIFAGILVVGLMAIVAGYGRLAGGPISLPSLIPPIETAINEQLSDLRVKIDDAVLLRSPDGPGVLFRLRNIRLIDMDGAIVAQAPLAAIGLSGSALLSGRVAPGSVDFIGPRVLLSYSADQGVALSFSEPPGVDSDGLIRGALPGDGSAETAAGHASPGTSIATGAEISVGGGSREFDLTNAVTDVFDRARRGDTSFLTRFGFKDAIVVLSQDGKQSLWQVPDFAIDLEHKGNRSILVGEANVASSRGDWQLEVRTEQHARRNSLGITALIENLVPSGIAGNFPSIGALRAFDMAVDGEAKVELSNAGKFLSGEAKLRLAPGQITPPWDRETPTRIDHGDFTVRYVKDTDVIELAPSTLRWGKSQATFSGEFRPVLDAAGKPASWDFSLKADNAVLGVEEFGLGPTKIDEWTATGNLSPEEGRLTISRFVIRAGDASVTVAGNVVDAPGSPAVSLAGEVSPMAVDTLKLFWPRFVNGKARGWVFESVAGGQILGGKFDVNLPGGKIAEMIEQGTEAPDGAVNAELNFTGVGVTYIDGLPPVVLGPSKITVSGTEFTVSAPKAKVVVASGQEIAVSDGRFFIPDLRVDPQQGVITFKGAGTTGTVMQLLDHEPLGYVRAIGMKPDFLGGTAEGEFILSMPMKLDLEFDEIKVSGLARINDAIASNLVGNMDIDGGALNVALSEQSVTATGEIKIKGVPAELHWQHVFDAADDQQPPIKVTATLDEALRKELGIKVNHLVKGPTPATLSVTNVGQPAQTMRMEADLTNAQLLFGSMGWTKPAGQAVTLSLDVLQNDDGSTDLKNLQMVGDGVAVFGEVSIDSNQHVKSFYFSDFSVNPQTHVEITANVRDDQVLDVTALGTSYDGKQFFSSLFSAGQLVDDGSADSSDPFGIDFTAKIGRVIGFHDTTATDVVVSLKKRDGRIVALNATGKLNGKSAAVVELEQKNGARLLKAEALDAGAAFRLVGFYGNIVGGKASLQVNLDAGSAGAKSGTLWAQDFAVVGDAVMTDVLTDPGAAAVLGNRKQQIARSRIVFKRLRAPFVVGGGKFRLNDAYMNGPALGATMRGTADFKSQTVDLSGTYVPLYGLNSALGAIPILGRVLVGRQGEGVVGITFAIKGKLDDPNVLVNPISVMTPGIFRQIFDFSGVPDPSATAAAPPKHESIKPFGSP